MKKCISIILIFTILINALFPNYIFAGKNGDNYANVVGSKDETTAREDVDKFFNDGDVSIPGEGGTTQDKGIAEKPNFGGWVASTLVVIFFPLVYAARMLMTSVAPATEAEPEFTIHWFTIQGLLTNKIELIDANIFNANTGNKANNTIKENIQKWYYAIWILATIINLLMLVYIGIRMAISTVASQKAVYKKKLMAWFESMVLLFVMHFIIRIIFFVSEILVQLLTNILNNIINMTMANSSIKNIDLAIFKELSKTLNSPKGWKPVEYFICYILLVGYEYKFLIMYIKRFMVIGLLVVVSPLITCTYSLDKAGDGKAQAFQILFKELIVNILMQPMHLFLYSVLLGFATNIIQEYPLFTILLLIGVSRGEKIIKQIFRMQSAVVKEDLNLKGKKKGK
ncbi:MAG TPA: hypothetical protein DDY53_05040 [Clostridiales bacterium]|jgi:hypothetical protein|nr:hypothetical protein [Clostridiales bacterium]